MTAVADWQLFCAIGSLSSLAFAMSYPSDMVIKTAPLSPVLIDPEQGMSLQVREVMNNIEYMRIVYWSKCIDLEVRVPFALTHTG